ncbi:MAG: haloacid dehalogenase [Anaerolineae bacterium]|nr:hypothetical protein [Thermoflexales bacterium]MDW8396548.1 haloacid dehalogenase [Anaerolineae bacterium]
MTLSQLGNIAERIRTEWVTKNACRDRLVNLSREAIRYAALAIRASHRDEWEEATRLLAEARQLCAALRQEAAPYPDLLYAGYTQDALKEFAEASLTLAIARGEALPDPESLGVDYAPYLNGLAEAAGELRRRALDHLRTGHSQESERLLVAMDEIYDVLVTMDFPDAITGNLRKNADTVRGVLERTRAELTISYREAELMRAIEALAVQLRSAQGE